MKAPLQHKANVVLHFNRCFFERTQTFVYSQVMGVRRWQAALACGEVQNLAEFPTDGLLTLDPYPRQGTLRGFYSKLLHKAGIRHLAFEEVLRQVKPRLVHAHFGPHGVDAVLPCRRAGMPLITSFYGYDSALPDSESGRKLKSGYKRLFATARFILVEGPCIARRLQNDWGCPAEKIRILRISIPVEQIAPREVTLRSERPIRLLFCGRLIEKKGLAVLIEALGRLGVEAKNYQLRVVGDGNILGALEQRVAALGLRDSVQFLGAQPRAQFWQELANCHLFVAPSVTASDGDTEGGAPTVLLEAQAAGVPLVTTNHADIPFVVVPQESAFMAAEGEVDSLVEALTEAVRQSARWPEMGAAGRKHVLANHSIPSVCQQLEEIYDEAAGCGPSS
jgi:colanic acid/amylovoran biosynthesis glycosyltransferase